MTWPWTCWISLRILLQHAPHLVIGLGESHTLPFGLIQGAGSPKLEESVKRSEWESDQTEQATRIGRTLIQEAARGGLLLPGPENEE